MTVTNMPVSAAELARLLQLPPPTTEQTAVIEAPLAPALVVAGAGSGKTETMAARVLYLVANGMVAPEQILGLTFTRKAASGLAARIRRRLRTLAAAELIGIRGQEVVPGPDGAGGDNRRGAANLGGGEPEVCTYHSFGGRLIGEFGPLTGMEPASRVLSATGSWQLARRVVARWDGDLDTDLGPDQVTERLLAMSGSLADHLIGPQLLADEIESVLAVLRGAPPSATQRGAMHSGLAPAVKRLQDRAWILPLVDAFTQAKRQAGVVDYADQMQVAAALAADHPQIGATLRQRYVVVLLDEYQDTGHAQRVILRALFGAGDDAPVVSGHPVTAVGDPVQSIYSWRGASASNLPRFPTDFPCRDGAPAATLTLSTSFRNATSVLSVANHVSAPIRAENTQVPELQARPGAVAGEIGYGLFETVAAEEEWLARRIADQWRAAGWQPAGMAVTRLTPPPVVADLAVPTTADVVPPTGVMVTGQAPHGGSAPAGEGAAATIPVVPPSTAVLLRRRRDMEPMAMALRAVGLPVEVVGLGGLLSEPEVADLLALLQVLVDPTAGPAAVRLLTGARWQLGMADLAALSARAAELAPRRAGVSGRSAGSRSDSANEADSVSTARPAADPGRAAVQDALAEAGSGEEVDSASLIDAISDPGPAERYSRDGAARLRRLRAELSRLRSRLSLPLSDLIAELERTTGLDVEVRTHSPAGRAHLDAFADVVADLAATGAGPAELVDYLLTAAEREDGLTPGEVSLSAGCVQILTVHAAKGLEWEIVAVPQLSQSIFPGSRGMTWLSDAAQLPPAVRGDAADLPQLRLPVGGDQKDMVAALAAHTDDLKAAQAVEERRLLYVAVTRTERVLLASGHQWGRNGSTPHGPSEFLQDVRSAAGPGRLPDEWAESPPSGQLNPLTAAPRSALWPPDALGDRRPDIRRGADLVLAALADRAVSPAGSSTGRGTAGSPSGGDRYGWSADVAALLAERNRLRSTSVEVALPANLSATAMVALADDPAGLARRIRRPVPHAPTVTARRGTAFHAWLERYFTGSALLEIADLPGAHDSGRRPDAEVEALTAAFERSVWARRVPFEIELPFTMTIAGQPVKGRVDAVFRDDDGGFTVVDWKTGRPPRPERLAAATVQLAVYRAAVADMYGVPLSCVRAAFVFVASGQTLAPADLLDAEGLAKLLRDATGALAPAVGGEAVAGELPTPECSAELGRAANQEPGQDDGYLDLELDDDGDDLVLDEYDLFDPITSEADPRFWVSQRPASAGGPAVA